MDKYYITARSNSLVQHYEQSNAKTIFGAKRAATIRYRGGYRDLILVVAEATRTDAFGFHDFRDIAQKPITGKRWESIL